MAGTEPPPIPSALPRSFSSPPRPRTEQSRAGAHPVHAGPASTLSMSLRSTHRPSDPHTARRCRVGAAYAWGPGVMPNRQRSDPACHRSGYCRRRPDLARCPPGQARQCEVAARVDGVVAASTPGRWSSASARTASRTASSSASSSSRASDAGGPPAAAAASPSPRSSRSAPPSSSASTPGTTTTAPAQLPLTTMAPPLPQASMGPHAMTAGGASTPNPIGFCLQCDSKDYFPSDPTEMQGWRS